MNKVAITGMGIVSSIGNDIPSFSNALRKGNSGIKHAINNNEPNLSVNIFAEILNFSFSDLLGRFENLSDEKLKHIKRLGQRAPFVIQTSIISALEAWNNSQLFEKSIDPERIGLVCAGQNSTQNYQYNLMSKFKENPEYLSPRYALEYLETNQLGVLSELFNIQGEGFLAGGACATGNVGLIKAYQSVKYGLVDACLIIAPVADLSPMDIQGFINIGAMGGKKFQKQANEACRPFDKQHEGFIYGQSSACIVLESTTSALKRNVPILAEIGGGAINIDANSFSNPNLEGEIKAMKTALKQGGISTSEVDYINTHGSSSPLGDVTEAHAIQKLLGNHSSNVWLNATKGITGHCLYSAGLVETIATVVQMNEGFLHPNKNLNEPIRDDLQFCGKEEMNHKIKIALSNSFGFGGINTSVVFKRTNN